MAETLKQNELVVTLKDLGSRFEASFSGTAGNEDAEFLQSTIELIKSKAGAAEKLVFDVADLSFCYSQCVKAFMGCSMNPTDRPPLEFIISNKAWQQTSLKAMVRMSPACTVTQASSCPHAVTAKDEEHFFAPTGNGSIVTTERCVACGHVVSKSSEYFD